MLNLIGSFNQKPSVLKKGVSIATFYHEGSGFNPFRLYLDLTNACLYIGSDKADCSSHDQESESVEISNSGKFDSQH